MKREALSRVRSNSLKPAPILQLVLVGVAALMVGTAGHYIQSSSKQDAPGVIASILPEGLSGAVGESLQKVAHSAPLRVIEGAGTSAAQAIAVKPELVTREIELDDGQTFAELLSDAGIPDTEANAAMSALSKAYDLRKLRAGQTVSLTVNHTPQAESFVSADFLPEATKELVVSRTADGTITATQKAVPVEHHRLAAAGQIRSTLYDAGDRMGVPHSVMAGLMHIYAHDVDFQRDIRPGDSFEVMYDQAMTSHGKAVGESTIIYAALNIAGKSRPVYRVTFSDNTVDYFDASGHSIRRALLRTPVAAAHVTSGFGMRVHPLLGYSKMHKGVDFGAPIGTPIFAAGTGTVDEIGFKNGYGRYIRLRHNGVMSTAYAHMSRFNANLFRGSRVTQGQVIGYVGMSGRATGPHLHFEVLVRNQQVNPMSINLPTGRALEGKLLTLFKQGQGAIRQEFQKYVQASAGKVVNVTLPAAQAVGRKLASVQQ